MTVEKKPGPFDLDVPFFRLAWRRTAVLVVSFGWAVFEFAIGAPMWGLLFIGAGAIAFWQFRTIDWSRYDTDQES